VCGPKPGWPRNETRFSPSRPGTPSPCLSAASGRTRGRPASPSLP
jgi:hypothetical protein